MISEYSETIRLKEASLKLVESGAISMPAEKLEELRGEILLLKRLESEDIKEGIEYMLSSI